MRSLSSNNSHVHVKPRNCSLVWHHVAIRRRWWMLSDSCGWAPISDCACTSEAATKSLITIECTSHTHVNVASVLTDLELTLW